jgi:hypothetical protein
MVINIWGTQGGGGKFKGGEFIDSLRWYHSHQHPHNPYVPPYHTHTSSWVFFSTKTPLCQLPTSSRPTTCSVSNNLEQFTSAPTPCSRSSLSYAHKFMGFFHNRLLNALAATSPTPTIGRVSNILVSFTQTPTPSSRS